MASPSQRRASSLPARSLTLSLALSLTLAACGPTPTGQDYVLERSGLELRPHAGGRVLFVNLDGVTVSPAGSDDARVNASSIAEATTPIPAFQPSLSAPSVPAADVKDVVFDRIRSLFRAYDLTITRTRPSSGSYTMIAVGGSHGIVGQPTGVAGVAPLDCSDANPNNVVYDFAADLTPDHGGVVSVALTAAHEYGHSVGLQHTSDPADIMFSVSPMMLMQGLDQLYGARFSETASYSDFNAGSGGGNPESCGRSNPINQNILPARLGLKVGGDQVPPALTWTLPADKVGRVPLSMPVALDVGDDVGVKRVEVYKNLELVKVLTGPPWQTTLQAAEGEAFYLVVEAVDAAANHTTQIRTFMAQANTPLLCRTDAECASGLTCKEGYCRAPLGAPCTTSLACETSFCAQPSGVCTQTCSASRPCPAGASCSGGTCVLGGGGGGAGRGEGEPCAAAAECASGLCLDVCRAPCDAEGVCLEGTCQGVEGGVGCVGAAAPPPMGAGGCAVGGEARPPAGRAGALALVALAAVALGRRRRATDRA